MYLVKVLQLDKALVLSLKALRKLYRILFNPDLNKNFLFKRTNDFTVVSGQAASDLISTYLSDIRPCMIARFGEIEMRCLANIYFMNQKKSIIKKVFNYLTYKSNSFWLEDYTLTTMLNNAGFFPVSIQNLQRFYELMVDNMKDTDVLGSWLGQEILFRDELKNSTKIPMRDLEPYYHNDPWTKVLEGKKVLVIHPFASSIASQYMKRELLFMNKEILPDFELSIINAVQSVAGNKTSFSDWFGALEYMKKQIDAVEFDVAIIGCGAYGFPLASYIKRIGKKAVHLGGPTQVLFGIIGARWEKHPFISKFINEHWVRPQKHEIPENINKVEGGCYW